MGDCIVTRVFTFGHGQPHFGKYHVVTAVNEHECRLEMNRRFGKQWSMMYENEEEAGVKEWNLKEIK